ncbi:MAG TPA: aldo/keto reductase [Conexibacter sp.]|nr:aldo/keto reductase [Conexibacter sp.]
MDVEIAPGVSMPLLGFGTWEMRGKTAEDAVTAALEIGYRHLDTARMYRNETEVGRALAASGLSRDEVFVTTKMWPDRAGTERGSIEESLEALGLEQVDLWLIHWPPGGARPDVWERFLEAQADGLARAVGVSNYSVAQLDELQETTGTLPAVNQVEWGPALHDVQVLEEHRRRGVQLEGYSPLKTTDLRHRRLVEIADAHGVTPAQVVIRWHLEHEIVVIPKSANVDRIAQNADVFGFSLGEDEVAALDQLGSGARRD